MKIKLGIIFGGKKIKDDESIDKTIELTEYIDKNKYDIVPIYISENKIWYTGKMLLEKDIYKYFDDLKKYAKQICIAKKKEHFTLQTTGNFKREVNYIDLVLPMIDNSDIFGFLDTMDISYIGKKTVDDEILLESILKANDIKTQKQNGKIYNCVLLSDLFIEVVKDDENSDDIPLELQDKMKDISKKLYDLFNIKGFFKVSFKVFIKEKQVYVDKVSTIIDVKSLYALDKKHKNYSNLIDDIISITIENYKEHEENS